jgi:arylformamidase
VPSAAAAAVRVATGATADRGARVIIATMTEFIDLSHAIRPGQITHPGLPAPHTEPFRTRDEFRAAAGTTFQIDRIEMVGNTGTYLDSPFHRFPDGGDLASLRLSAVADLPIVVVARSGARRAVDAELIADAIGGQDLEGFAVLLRTGGDVQWGTPAYGVDAPFLSADGARWLAERKPALVGIDAVNIDDLADLSRPAHTDLLAAGVLVLEHLTRLGDLPADGARLHAAPPAWHGVGTWPVRAYAIFRDNTAR